LHGLISVDGEAPSLASISLFSEAAQLYFVAIWIFNGLCQSTGGPLLTSILGKFFKYNERGFVFGKLYHYHYHYHYHHHRHH